MSDSHRAASRWGTPETVAGFARAAPNAILIAWARGQRAAGAERALDLGCGAGRNAVPLAALGFRVTGLDDAWPMLVAAAGRTAGVSGAGALDLVRAAMDRLPFPDARFDLVVAHGVWNLARSTAELRRGMAEAARVARPGSGLFVFTFSRRTLAKAARPVGEERYVYDQFAGEPQCFLAADELLAELASVGFAPDPALPLRELGVAAAPALQSGPAILEGAFRRAL